MSKQAKASFENTGWDEKPYNEIDGELKMTHASVTRIYAGKFRAMTTVEYVMLYREDGSASFEGLERVVGSLGDRAGSFVLQHNGTFEDGVAKYSFSVVPGSGTRDLAGLRGEGEFASGHQQHYPYTLTYYFERSRKRLSSVAHAIRQWALDCKRRSPQTQATSTFRIIMMFGR